MRNEIYNKIEKNINEKVVKFLLMQRHQINSKLNVKHPIDTYIYQFGLCTDDKRIQSFLDQVFREQGLKYYNSLGGLIENPNEYQKCVFYRFENNDKRLEFIENLLIELYNE